MTRSRRAARYPIGPSLAVLAALLAVPAQGQAQDVPPAAPDAAADAAPAEPEAGVGEIVVTARKRSELARDVPVSVTAVSGELLRDRNVARLTDMVALVPNFTLSLAANQPLAFIRGFGSGGSPVFEQAVGKFVDNISFGRDFDGRVPLFDLERVEVLKGPQVLLYGNSATAGALNITTRKPGRTFAADGSVSYEFENDEALVQGGVTAPLGDTVSLRVAGLYQDLDRGWIRNVGNGRREPTFTNWALRSTLRFEPSSAVDITLKAEYDHLRDRGAVSQPIRQAASPARAFNDVTRDDRRESNYDVAPFFMNETNGTNAWLFQGDVGVDTGIGTLTSTTGYRHGRNVGIQGNASQKPSAIVVNGQNFSQFSQELRLAGTAGSLDYVVGGFYQRDEQHIYSLTLVNPVVFALPFPAFGSFRSFDGVADSYSEFADLTYHVTPEFSVSAGARYTQIRKNADQLAAATNFTPRVDFDTRRAQLAAAINPALNSLFTTVFGGLAHSFTDIRTRENHLQPQVVVQYKFTPDVMAYAKFVKGDKAGGVDANYQGSVQRGLLLDDARFEPERAVSFEGGVKGITADRKLEYALTAFQTTFTNLQTSVFVGTSLFVTNAGKARSKGLEAELNWAPARGLRVRASGTWQDGEYADYSGVACDVQATLPVSPTGGCDLSGRQLPFLSKLSGSLGVDYGRPIGNGMAVEGGASIVARSKYLTSLNNDPLGLQKAFATLDAYLDLRADDRAWTVSLFGRNLTNRKYIEYSVATPLVPGGYNVFLSRGRQLGVRLSGKF